MIWVICVCFSRPHTITSYHYLDSCLTLQATKQNKTKQKQHKTSKILFMVKMVMCGELNSFLKVIFSLRHTHIT